MFGGSEGGTTATAGSGDLLNRRTPVGSFRPFVRGLAVSETGPFTVIYRVSAQPDNGPGSRTVFCLLTSSKALLHLAVDEGLAR